MPAYRPQRTRYRSIGQGMPRQRQTWAIRVTYQSGEDAYLRHGGEPGVGPIVRFRSRRDAELNAEAMVAPGLEAGSTVTVVRAPMSDEV